MADDIATLIVDRATGIAVNAVLGEAHATDTLDAVPRTGSAAAAWIGWTQNADGSWTSPYVPAPDTPETLAAYARAQSRVIEESGIDFAGSRIATDRSSQGLVDRAVGLFAADPSLTEVEFDTGTAVVTLTGDQMKAIGIAVGRHVQTTFVWRAAALRGIVASPPTVTTRADVDARLSGN